MSKIFFLLLTICATIELKAQGLDIYEVSSYGTDEKNSFAFISLSDKYLISEHADSLPIPRLKNHLQVFELEGLYRKRLLDNTKTSETDLVFIYDYSKDILVTLKVNQLSTYACLNNYSDSEEAPFPDHYYMFGFKIDKNLLLGSDVNYDNSLVYIGKGCPFVKGGIRPIMWKKIKPKDFPKQIVNKKNEELLDDFGLNGYSVGAVWQSELDGYKYSVMDILTDGRVYARHLKAMKLKDNKLVLDKIFVDDEGSSLSPLNYTDSEYPSINQFAGRLFKDTPPVIFGFEFVSFGCQRITFLDPYQQDLNVNCDNRH